MKVLIITADGYEDMELFYPYWRLVEEGIRVDVASLQKGVVTGKHGYEMKVDRTMDEVNPDDYGILIIPGGSKASLAVRQSDRALVIARAFFEKNKPVASICHGPQVLISAGVMRGRKATCYSGASAEMKEAGVVYEDAEVIVDGNLITSRKPHDLPAFMREVMKMIKNNNHQNL